MIEMDFTNGKISRVGDQYITLSSAQTTAMPSAVVISSRLIGSACATKASESGAVVMRV